MNVDTIAAIATALNDSGIGIIRISGPEALNIIDKIYQSKDKNKKLSKVRSHTIHYGFIVDNDEIIDEVMVSIMLKPNTYTKEDVVEINCHGGLLVVKKVLENVVKNGARVAEPGEFTKRAFLNGRIDLTKAEAVMDLIHSKSEYALKSSVNQLKGSVSKLIKNYRDKILFEIAFIESALDDPEHISLDGYQEKLSGIVDDLISSIDKLIDSADNGKMLKEGINTVIVGKPNAGKSSLLNLLVGEEKAIVTSVAGTTRDVLEESIKLKGVSLNIIDTAGIRDTIDEVEKIGVEKARKYALNADLIIYVVDASIPLDESDIEICSMIKDKNVVILLNKTDLSQIIFEKQLEGYLQGNKHKYFVRTSTKENIGVDQLEDIIENMFFAGKISMNDEVYITNMRHKQALVSAYDSLKMVKQSLLDNMPEDFYSIDLMSAYSSLGTIIGEEIEDDLVNEIFSKFCMGK